MIDVSVVVPVKNDARRLQVCLASLRYDPRDPSSEIIVIDNGSSDESVAVASSAGARVLVLPHRPVAALRNAGADLAKGRLLAFVDADHEVGAEWLADASRAISAENIGAAGALYLSPPAGTWVQTLYGALRGRTVGRAETSWLASGNLIVRREAFQAIGGFDDRLEACEDVDFCRRLSEAGWSIVADERLKSVHHGDPLTLRALFRAERWRGRDNIRVSLRGSLTLRDLPSIVAPVLTACAVVGLVLSSFFWLAGWNAALPLAVACAAIPVVLALIRTLRMCANLNRWTLLVLLQAFSVGVTYEVARATALLSRASHHRR